MTMLKAEEYMAETRELSGVQVRVVSYKIGDHFYCHVENFDPGATIARADGNTRAHAVQLAVIKADGRLK
jgi:hypothetical protein